MSSFAIVLYVLLVCVLFWAIPVLVFRKISSILAARRQKRLDEIAHEIVDDFDAAKEQQEISYIAHEGKKEVASIARLYVLDKYKCPKCDGILVPREGRQGKFMGCNKYPTCKYMRSSE